MAKKFDLNDDTVAVVIGSGAGGGTLSKEQPLEVGELLQIFQDYPHGL